MARFVKGQSGNPSGRPKAAQEMARIIREKTNQGVELVDYALKVLRDTNATERNRAWAADWLADRGFGKPQQALDVTSGDQPIQGGINFAGLTREQLELIAQVSAPDSEPDGRGDG